MRNLEFFKDYDNLSIYILLPLTKEQGNLKTKESIYRNTPQKKSLKIQSRSNKINHPTEQKLHRYSRKSVMSQTKYLITQQKFRSSAFLNPTSFEYMFIGLYNLLLTTFKQNPRTN